MSPDTYFLLVFNPRLTFDLLFFNAVLSCEDALDRMGTSLLLISRCIKMSPIISVWGTFGACWVPTHNDMYAPAMMDAIASRM